MLEIQKNNKYAQSEKPLVLGVFEDAEKVLIDPKIDSDIASLIKEKQLKFEIGKVNKVFTFGKIKNQIVYLIGLGKKAEYSYEKLEESLREVNYKLGSELHIQVGSFSEGLDEKEAAKRIIQTVSAYNYKYDECLSEKINNDLSLKLISSQDLSEISEEAFQIATAIDNTRDLINKPYNYLSATDLADYAVKLADSLDDPKIRIRVYGKTEIAELGMNAFLGVNKGSSAEPKLIHIVYENSKKPAVAIVGKGLMYDTGGYSIKTQMNNMKDDMSGAATVLGVFELAVKRQLPVNLHVVICATDNRINGEALLPDDVLTAMNKKTIEIVSTDAEGRLTLADAVCFAQKQGAAEVIDLATLTGAVCVALGEYTVGLFGNDQKTVEKMLAAGKAVSEEIWQLPINDYIRKQVHGSKVADLTNSTGKNMGASSGAAFIEAFIDKPTKWMHLDIAGTAFHTSPFYKEFYGATGMTVKTLYQYLKDQSL